MKIDMFSTGVILFIIV